MEHKKPKLNRQTLLEDARFFGLLNLGLILTALGIVLFKSPNQFAFGGTSGLSVILATLFPQWNVGAFMWVINIALVVLGFCLLGRKSMGWTVYSSFALSFYVSLCEWIWPLSAPLTDDTFLEFCFAVLLPALGGAIVFNVGASTGGTDILAMILQKYTSMEIGRALMVSDLGIAALTLKTAMQSAWLNVLINLSSLKDKAFADECCKRGEEMLAHAIPLAEESYEKALRLITGKK